MDQNIEVVVSVLVDKEIRKLVEERELITNFAEQSLEGASYDMRVGPEYIKQGKIEPLDHGHPNLILQPGEFVLLRSLEELNMPLNLIGHNGIMSPWAKRGLVSLFSPQIDPGFSGFLTVPVFNAGDAPITIAYHDKMFTVEFVRTAKNASRGWSDRFGRQDKLSVLVSPSFVRPNLADIGVLQSAFHTLEHKFEQLSARQASVDSEFRVVEAMVGTRRDSNNRKLSAWNLLMAALALIFAVAIGVFGSDWLRTQVLEVFRALHL